MNQPDILTANRSTKYRSAIISFLEKRDKMKLTVSHKIDILLFLMVFIAGINMGVIYHYHSNHKND